MKKLIFFILVTLSFSYELKEFATCKNVQNLTPINITNTFDATDKKVYAFAYFINIKNNKNIDFLWEEKIGNEWKLYTDIKLPIFTGVRWRTYSYITISPFFRGEWRVSLIDGNKTVAVKNFIIK